MSGTQSGLKVAFYIYPCLLFLSLLGSQSLEHYRNRRKGTQLNVSDAQKQKSQNIQRLYNRVIWILQLIVSLLLLASVILAVIEAITGQHAAAVLFQFPFSGYVVRAPFPMS